MILTGDNSLTEKPEHSAGITGDREVGKTRAAEYVRMSTEHQKYSTENQSDAIHIYANQHDIEIVKTYSDAGKSGAGFTSQVQLLGFRGTPRRAFDSRGIFGVSN